MTEFYEVRISRKAITYLMGAINMVALGIGEEAVTRDGPDNTRLIDVQRIKQ